MSDKKYIIKDGNSSTSKYLILDARLHLSCLSSGSPLSFGLACTLIFSVRAQKCVKILAWEGWCPACCNAWGSVPAGGGSPGGNGLTGAADQANRSRQKLCKVVQTHEEGHRTQNLADRTSRNKGKTNLNQHPGTKKRTVSQPLIPNPHSTRWETQMHMISRLKGCWAAAPLLSTLVGICHQGQTQPKLSSLS